MRLTRRDGDQDLTRFSATLPPGMVGQAGRHRALPRRRDRRRQGQERPRRAGRPQLPGELQIGRVAGRGRSRLRAHLRPRQALPGRPLQRRAAQRGGDRPRRRRSLRRRHVVVRQALRIDPRTAEVTVDGAASDPIPHILAGIPLQVRDIRVYVDRPEFTLNPTSCEPSAVGAQIWGGGVDVFSSLDDSPLSRSGPLPGRRLRQPRLQAAPRPEPRGRHPPGRAPRPARPLQAPARAMPTSNGLVLRLPRLGLPRPGPHQDDLHPRPVRRQAHAPRERSTATPAPSPRSSTNPSKARSTCAPPTTTCPTSSPTCTASSTSKRSPASTPSRAASAPPSKTSPTRRSPKSSSTCRAARKGLIVNSTDLCAAKHRANAKLTGQNGKVYDTTPVLRAKCKGGKHKRHKSHRRHG